jgi:acetyl-CoA carboxylase carboxyltransferase component
MAIVDAVIEPSQTRPVLINALQMLQNKRDSNPPKKHGNIPLVAVSRQAMRRSAHS